MTTKNIVQVTDQNFETTVSTSSQLVLVDFWATWCAPCKMLRPVIEELATEYDGRMVVGELDVDANPITASKFTVLSIPSVILFRAGKPAEPTSDRRSTASFNLHPARGCMGSGGLHGLQNRWSASLAMSTDGSFPSRPRQFLNSASGLKHRHLHS